MGEQQQQQSTQIGKQNRAMRGGDQASKEVSRHGGQVVTRSRREGGKEAKVAEKYTWGQASFQKKKRQGKKKKERKEGRKEGKRKFLLYLFIYLFL
jgi:hypothetical protein